MGKWVVAQTGTVRKFPKACEQRHLWYQQVWKIEIEVLMGASK